MPYRQALFGVNAELRQYSPSRLNDHLTLMANSGVSWVRQFIDWAEIEQEAGQFDWAKYDLIFEALSHYPDLRPVVVFFGAPSWARRIEHPTSPPSALEPFEAFARAFAQRYGHVVHYYQIWDEPNLREAWGNIDPSPTHYAALLQTGYHAVKSTDPSSFVLAAALAPTTEDGPRNLNEWEYLREIYRLGANQYFDAAAAKPYGFNTSPADRSIRTDKLNFSRIVVLREIMESYGDGAKALWASHWGWNSLPSDWRGRPSIWGLVSSEERQRYSLEALERAAREWPWLGGMIFHHWQPDVPLDDPQWGFSLLTPSDEPTTLLQALSAHIPKIPQDGLYHPTHPQARYTGVWTLGPLGADIGWLETSDSRVEFSFTGRDVALLLRRGDYLAFLYPRLASHKLNALPYDNAGNPYVILQSADLTTRTELVKLAENLPLEQHLLSITADRGWDRWALAGFAVSSGNLSRAYDQALSASWLWIVLSLGAAAVSLAHVPHPSRLSEALKNSLNGLGFAGQVILSGLASVILMVAMWMTWSNAPPTILRREAAQYTLGLLLSGGLVALEPNFILVVLSLAALLILFYHRLELGVLLTLFWSPFFLFPVELYRFAFPLAEIVLLITVSAWALRTGVNWARRWRTSPSQARSMSRLPKRWRIADALMLTWAIMAFVSLIWTKFPAPAFTEIRTLIVEPILLYALLRNIADERILARSAWALILSGFSVSVIGLVFFFRGEAVITTLEGTGRLASVYGSPNNVALLLGRALPFVASLALLRPHWRWPLVVLSLPMLTAFLLTQSVGGLALGLPLGLTAALLAAKGLRHWRYVLALVVVLLAGITLVGQASPRFANLFDPTRGTNFIRLRVWESSFNILAERPLTGLGMDQFLYAYRERYILPDAIADKDLSHPHNILLDHWLRFGVMGLIWISLVIVYLTHSAWRRANDAGTDRWVAVGVFGAWVATVAHGLIDNSLYVQDLALIFAFFMACSAKWLHSS
ncbi:MAG: O-antigen ligase family protein [Anaerolineae bacterium]|nr:O-antigen ligase family protein [Anaerolineae bacterium]